MYRREPPPNAEPPGLASRPLTWSIIGVVSLGGAFPCLPIARARIHLTVGRAVVRHLGRQPQSLQPYPGGKMSPHQIAIVYGTRYGQTTKIAERMTDVLAAEGHTVPILRADSLPADFSLSPYDGVIIGRSVIAGRHQRYLERFVRQRRDALNRVPSAFFSVGASAAGSSDRDQSNARRVLVAFLTKTGWHPRLTAPIGGAMAFTKYGAFTRMLLEAISRRSGGPTDTSRDHELTNWDQVTRFADEFAASLPEPAALVCARP